MEIFSAFPDQPVRPDAAWSLGHLRPALWVSLGLAVLGVPIAWMVRDWRGALAVLVGLAIVAAFFCFGAWAVAKAGEKDDRLTFPAALGSYLIKISLLGVVLVTIPRTGPIDIPTLAITVVIGTVVWSGVQIRYVLSRKLFYVDYKAPSQVPDD